MSTIVNFEQLVNNLLMNNKISLKDSEELTDIVYKLAIAEYNYGYEVGKEEGSKCNEFILKKGNWWWTKRKK